MSEATEARREMTLDEWCATLPEGHRVRRELQTLRNAALASFAALRTVEDWQWGKRERDLRDDQLLSAETVRPMVTEAVRQIKEAIGQPPEGREHG